MRTFLIPLFLLMFCVAGSGFYAMFVFCEIDIYAHWSITTISGFLVCMGSVLGCAAVVLHYTERKRPQDAPFIRGDPELEKRALEEYLMLIHKQPNKY
jgi:hypothetical protein